MGADRPERAEPGDGTMTADRIDPSRRAGEAQRCGEGDETHQAEDEDPAGDQDRVAGHVDGLRGADLTGHDDRDASAVASTCSRGV